MHINRDPDEFERVDTSHLRDAQLPEVGIERPSTLPIAEIMSAGVQLPKPGCARF